MSELSTRANQVAENAYLKLSGRISMAALWLLSPVLIYLAKDVYESNRQVTSVVIELKARFEENLTRSRESQASLVEVFNSRMKAQDDRVSQLAGQIGATLLEIQKTNETQNAAIEELRRRVYQLPIPLRVQTP